MDKRKMINYGNVFLTVLLILASILTILSLLLAMGLKRESISSSILPYYSRYKLAMEAIKVFEADPQTFEDKNGPVKDDQGNPIQGTLLGIDNHSWQVMLDFIRSEIAFRKSDRNYRIDEKQNTDEPSKNQSAYQDSEINWDRIKTIFVLYIKNVAKVGNKPLAEPYRALVFWPGHKGNNVYSFLSFEEFRLDLKAMLTQELEYYSYFIALIGAIGTILIPIVKKYLRKWMDSGEKIL